MTTFYLGRRLPILFAYLCFGCSLFSADSIDIIKITSDTPFFKLDLSISAGWVHMKTLTIRKDSEDSNSISTAGWIIQEFRPADDVYKSIFNIPINPGVKKTPEVAKNNEKLWHITIYYSSGTIDSYYISSEKELTLPDGNTLKNDAGLVEWFRATWSSVNSAP